MTDSLTRAVLDALEWREGDLAGDDLRAAVNAARAAGAAAVSAARLFTAVSRLTAEGLVENAPGDGGGFGRRLIRLTPSGREVARYGGRLCENAPSPSRPLVSHRLEPLR